MIFFLFIFEYEIGDDPKDVKARLKVWAQAVALASTSPQILSS